MSDEPVYRQPSRKWVGWVFFAATLMLLVGFSEIIVGVVMAVVSVLTNVAFLAAYPIWSVTIIVVDLIAIYALIVHGGEVEDAVDL
jgi:hypothetical protein